MEPLPRRLRVLGSARVFGPSDGNVAFQAVELLDVGHDIKIAIHIQGEEPGPLLAVEGAQAQETRAPCDYVGTPAVWGLLQSPLGATFSGTTPIAVDVRAHDIQLAVPIELG